MENEIYENGVTPEMEEVVETVVEEQPVMYAQPEEAPKATATDNVITATLKMAADKGKELIENPKTIWEKIKAVPAKIWMFVGGGVAALLAIIVVLSLLGNTYKTPIKAVEKTLNSKSVNQVLNRAPAILNGFGEDEAKVLINIAKKSDQYKDYKDDIDEGFESLIEGLEENVGKNYKIKLKVTDKEKLGKDEKKAFREQLRSIGNMAEQFDEMDNDDYADMADELGISKAQVKKAVKTVKSFCKDCKSAKVQKGYKLTVEAKVTGKELDEPMEMEIPVNVYKVDGRWVIDVFSLAQSAMGMLGGFGMSNLLGGLL